MSEIRANSITDAAGTGAPNFPNGLESDGVAVATAADLGSVTLLGTIATTSGTSATLSGLTLTGYKFLNFSFENVSGTLTSAELRLNGFPVAYVTYGAAADYATGSGIINLSDGAFLSGSSYTLSGSRYPTGGGGMSGLSTSSTSITFTISRGNFDAGSIRIYGVK
jgi:hypothetical protein